MPWKIKRWTPHGSAVFSMKGPCEALRLKSKSVRWYQLVWYSHHIPRWSFILWLTCTGRLAMKDRMASWGIINTKECVLCDAGMEDDNHSIIECSFSRQVWMILLEKRGTRRNLSVFLYELEWAIQTVKGNSSKLLTSRSCFMGRKEQ